MSGYIIDRARTGRVGHCEPVWVAQMAPTSRYRYGIDTSSHLPVHSLEYIIEKMKEFGVTDIQSFSDATFFYDVPEDKEVLIKLFLQ